MLNKKNESWIILFVMSEAVLVCFIVPLHSLPSSLPFFFSSKNPGQCLFLFFFLTLTLTAPRLSHPPLLLGKQ